MTYRYVLLMVVIPNSGDFIQVSLPSANVNLRYDWTTGGQFGSTQDYEVFDESFFYVHFETGNPPEIKNGSLDSYYWVMYVDLDYKSTVAIKSL
uniref:Uncharacterized protein n=1 Tax=Acrobeloides nanus TaxID=290746 RepID=A0A914D6A6_9BILA